jgi:hypothetical protein
VWWEVYVQLLTGLDTSHVPCKFYRQGACQAGKACPFLHSDEPVTERAPCKYFTKVGNITRLLWA